MLDRFFEVMRAFLDGEIQASDVERALGPSPSGTARLALYATLVARQRMDVLSTLFCAPRHACEALREGLWDELARAFTRQHPPRHWEPNRFGEPMAEFLAERRANDATLPAYLEELADYAFIRVAAATALPPQDGVGMDRSLFVRRYEWDVVSFTRVVKDGPIADRPAAPAAQACSLIVAWSSTAHRVMELQPSLATLAAIGQRLQNDAVTRRSDAPDAAQIAQAERELVDRGILPPRAGEP